MDHLFLLYARVEAVARATPCQSYRHAADVEDLLNEVSEVSAALAAAARETEHRSRAWRRLTFAIEQLARHKEALETRKRELERQETETAERNAYMHRVAQREREALAQPIDRGRPAYAKGA